MESQLHTDNARAAYRWLLEHNQVYVEYIKMHTRDLTNVADR